MPAGFRSRGLFLRSATPSPMGSDAGTLVVASNSHMDLQLNGKTALVTGSTAGIGHAIATALAGEDATVIVNGRTQARVDEAIKSIQAKHKHAKVSGIAADLGTREGATAVVRALPEIDILINNLGIFEPKAFVDITDEDWEHIFEVNVLSGVRLSRQYLPVMLKKNWGRIVFISSESAVNIPTEMIHYGVTKTAQPSNVTPIAPASPTAEAAQMGTLLPDGRFLPFGASEPIPVAQTYTG